MNLDKVEKFTKEIDRLKNKIEGYKQRIANLKKCSVIDICEKNDCYNSEHFKITENNIYLDTNSQAVKTFKILALDELAQGLLKTEKELKEFIENGVPEEKKELESIQKCSNCNKEGAF